MHPCSTCGSQGDDGLKTPEYWKDRADEARARSDEMRDTAAKDLMLYSRRQR